MAQLPVAPPCHLDSTLSEFLTQNSISFKEVPGAGWAIPSYCLHIAVVHSAQTQRFIAIARMAMQSCHLCAASAQNSLERWNDGRRCGRAQHHLRRSQRAHALRGIGFCTAYKTRPSGEKNSD